MNLSSAIADITLADISTSVRLAAAKRKHNVFVSLTCLVDYYLKIVAKLLLNRKVKVSEAFGSVSVNTVDKNKPLDGFSKRPTSGFNQAQCQWNKCSARKWKLFLFWSTFNRFIPLRWEEVDDGVKLLAHFFVLCREETAATTLTTPDSQNVCVCLPRPAYFLENLLKIHFTVRIYVEV